MESIFGDNSAGQTREYGEGLHPLPTTSHPSPATSLSLSPEPASGLTTPIGEEYIGVGGGSERDLPESPSQTTEHGANHHPSAATSLSLQSELAPQLATPIGEEHTGAYDGRMDRGSMLPFTSTESGLTNRQADTYNDFYGTSTLNASSLDALFGVAPLGIANGMSLVSCRHVGLPH